MLKNVQMQFIISCNLNHSDSALRLTMMIVCAAPCIFLSFATSPKSHFTLISLWLLSLHYCDESCRRRLYCCYGEGAMWAIIKLSSPRKTRIDEWKMISVQFASNKLLEPTRRKRWRRKKKSVFKFLSIEFFFSIHLYTSRIGIVSKEIRNSWVVCYNFLFSEKVCFGWRACFDLV